MKLFRRNVYTLNRVRDRITVREGKETIDLYVDSDARMLVSRILNAQRKLDAVNADTPEEDRENAARTFSVSIFGEEQTQKLADFYHGDYGCVVAVCGMYFADEKHGLGKKITRVQKKAK